MTRCSLDLDHIQLAIPIGGEEQARTFYAGLLGLREIPKPEELAARGGVWFHSGNLAVHLGVEADFRPARKAHPAFACSDYHGLLARLRAAHATIVDDESLFESHPHCYVDDPFGNRIELIDRSGKPDPSRKAS
ncbi:MAG: VOC family protein [Vulcanimicrobiaceae bacterium]